MSHVLEHTSKDRDAVREACTKMLGAIANEDGIVSGTLVLACAAFLTRFAIERSSTPVSDRLTVFDEYAQAVRADMADQIAGVLFETVGPKQ